MDIGQVWLSKSGSSADLSVRQNGRPSDILNKADEHTLYFDQMTDITRDELRRDHIPVSAMRKWVKGFSTSQVRTLSESFAPLLCLLGGVQLVV